MTRISRLGARWRSALGARTVGFPTSSNGASSLHLQWLDLPTDDAVIAASVTLEVVVEPAVPHLYFWALQASFVDGRRAHGAGHLGLQWYPPHPGATAVNWGGYDSSGVELDGGAARLPSATGNPNTRDFRWEPRRPYRLEISAGSSPGSWTGSVDRQVLRDLHASGTGLADVMVWSEVFARCDDPSVVVRWSDFSARTRDRTIRPRRLAVSYQSGVDGGCANTSVQARDGTAEQITNVARTTSPGAVLAL